MRTKISMNCFVKVKKKHYYNNLYYKRDVRLVL